jgi:septum formation protein
VVGSDTIILFNNKIINKAKTIEEAKKKLQKLSGKKHQIISGASVCLIINRFGHINKHLQYT